MSPSTQGTDPRQWLAELKGNRKTQVALLGLVASIAFVVWMFTDSKPKGRRAQARITSGKVKMDAKKLTDIARLPSLASLSKAGILPGEERVARDPFLFEGVAAKNVQIFIPPPPPPPETPEEIEAKRLAADKEAQRNTAPRDLRYLGTLASPSKGILVAFMKGEESQVFSLGSTPVKGWKLIKADEKFVEFENLKYADIRHRVEAKDGGSPSGPGGRTSNEF